MPDLFAFSDSCQAILDCCPFLWPTAGLVEAVCSFSAILFSGSSNLFLEHWSWYRYCSRYPYWLFWQNLFFCQGNWRQLCLSWLGTQQEPGDLSQKVSSLMMNLSERDIDYCMLICLLYILCLYLVTSVRHEIYHYQMKLISCFLVHVNCKICLSVTNTLHIFEYKIQRLQLTKHVMFSSHCFKSVTPSHKWPFLLIQIAHQKNWIQHLF